MLLSEKEIHFFLSILLHQMKKYAAYDGRNGKTEEKIHKNVRQ